LGLRPQGPKWTRRLDVGKVKNLRCLLHRLLKVMREKYRLHVGIRKFLILLAPTPESKRLWTPDYFRVSNTLRRTVIQYLRDSSLIRSMPKPLRRRLNLLVKYNQISLAMHLVINKARFNMKHLHKIVKTSKKKSKIYFWLLRNSTRWKTPTRKFPAGPLGPSGEYTSNDFESSGRLEDGKLSLNRKAPNHHQVYRLYRWK
jgi:hypothetical protein